MTTTPITSFRQIFSFEDFMIMHNCLSPTKEDQANQRNINARYVVYADLSLKLAIIMREKQKQALIKPIAGIENHSIDCGNRWNEIANLAADDNTHDDKRSEFFIDYIARDFVWNNATETVLKRTIPESLGEPTPSAEEAYDTMITTIDAGNLTNEDDVVREEHQCLVDGIRYTLTVRNWQAGFEYHDYKEQLFLPISPLPEPELHTFEISFPTGDLIAFDTIEMRMFNRFDDVVAELSQATTINCEHGRVKQTIGFATFHNIIKIWTHQSPEIFTREGNSDNPQIIGGTLTNPGHKLPNDCGWQKQARIDTDVSSCFIMERSTLIAILANDKNKRIPPDQKEKNLSPITNKIRCLIETNAIKRIRVEPGTYHLYFTGDEDKAPNLFDRYETSIDPAIIPIFLLSRNPLVRKN